MLEKLNQLQRFDLDLDALDHEKQQTPPELNETQAKKEALQAELAQVQQRHDEVRRQVNENELELKNLEARRKSAADAAIAAGAGREAAQYQNQELQFTTRIQDLEEDTLPRLEQLEGLEAEVARLKGEVAEIEPELQALVDEENARVAKVDKKIRALASERDALAREIEGNLLKQYEQVRRSKRGLGLVAVEAQQRCGGCNMHLPIHVVQKVLKARGVTRCPSCGRILWVPPH